MILAAEHRPGTPANALRARSNPNAPGGLVVQRLDPWREQTVQALLPALRLGKVGACGKGVGGPRTVSPAATLLATSVCGEGGGGGERGEEPEHGQQARRVK